MRNPNQFGQFGCNDCDAAVMDFSELAKLGTDYFCPYCFSDDIEEECPFCGDFIDEDTRVCMRCREMV